MGKEIAARLKNIPNASKIRGIRFLTCQGGGMKGGAYTGSAQVLEQTGVLSQLEVVAGTSAGAIFAMLIALGYTAKEINEEMSQLDFTRLQDKDAPGWIESSGVPALLKNISPDPKDKFNLLNQLPVVKQLMGVPRTLGVGLDSAEDVIGLVLGNKLGIWKGDALVNLIQRLIARKTGKPNLTFKELKKLAKLKPGVFKELVLVGTNLSTQEKEYYNAEDWPDMPLWTAIRISLSIPGLYQPIQGRLLKRKGVHGEPDEYSDGLRVDGGVLENLPDVFLCPPYHRHNDLSHNPEVLALSFKPSEKKASVNSGFALLRALYETVMSEKDLQRQYGQNIVFIDTKGVDTLSFDIDKKQSEELINSGFECTQKVLETILESEGKRRYEELSFEELLRLKVFLLLDEDKDIELSDVNAYLLARASALGISNAQLEKYLETEREKRDKLIAVLKKRDGKTLTDQELQEDCQQKILELSRVKQEQLTQIKEIYLMLAGLELQSVDFQTRFQKNKVWVENLDRQLLMLNTFKDTMKDIRRALAKLEQEKEHIIQVKKTDDKTDREQVNVKLSVLNAEINFKNNQIEDLKYQKETFISGVLSGYRSQDDDFMQHFFKRLRTEFDQPERTLSELGQHRTQLPRSSRDIMDFLNKETEICYGYLKEAKLNYKTTKEELKKHEQFYKNFEKRSLVSESYTRLKTLQSELDHSIYEKTSLIAKINNYFVSDKPSWKNTIMTGALQMVALSAFVLKSTFSFFLSPATIPSALYHFVEIIKNKTVNKNNKKTSGRLLSHFETPDLFKYNKLRALSKVTADAVRALDKNYEKADVSEHAHIHKLFSLYLGKSGIRFRDIFSKKSHQTETDYLTMLNRYEQKLVLEGLSTDPKGFNKTPLYKNFEVFYKNVKEKLERKALKTNYKERPKRDQEAAQIWDKIHHSNVLLTHQDYINKINKDIQAFEKKGTVFQMDSQTLFQYMESSKILDLDLPTPMRNKFINLLNNDNLDIATPEAIHRYYDLAEHFNLEMPESLRRKKVELDAELIQQERDSDQVKRILKSFYSKRSQDRSPPKPPRLTH